MGGAFTETLPPAMRVAALVQAAILAIAAIVVLSKAGLLFPAWQSFASAAAAWFVVPLSALATVLNVMTRSKRERTVWAPVSLLLLATSLIVAFG
ncbi:hypothetical protein [Paenibacillus flagellatus]|nr:hypothetical protein [Paenibacillus flagellatus]